MAQARLLIHGRYFPAVFEHGRNSVLGDGILSAYLRWPRSLLSGTSCSFLAWQPAGTTRVLSIWVCMLLLYTLVGESEFVNIKMFVQPHLTLDSLLQIAYSIEERYSDLQGTDPISTLV